MNVAPIEPLPMRIPPFERPRGRRGARGRAAALVALVSVFALLVAHRHGTLEAGSVTPGYSISWHTVFAHPAQAVVLWLSAAAYLAAASSLWRAQTRRMVAWSVVAALAATAGSVWSIANATNHARPTLAAINALPLGLSPAAVTERLGQQVAASAHATALRGDTALPCMLYTIGAKPTAAPFSPPPSGRFAPIGPSNTYAVLCFAQGRLIMRAGE